MAGIFEPTNKPNWADDLVAGAPTDDYTAPADALVKAGWTHGSGGPSRGYFNWLLSELHNGVQYFMNRGLPLWNSARAYVAGSVVRGPGGGTWVALDASTGSAPEAGTSHWLPFAAGGRFGDHNDPDRGQGGGAHDAVIAADTTIGGDQTFRNLTVNAGKALTIQNGVLRVQGTLTVASSGTICPDVQGSLVGGNGTGGPSGAGGTGANDAANGFSLGGGGGGTGGGAPNGPGANGKNVDYSFGGAGGAGGTGGGAGGTGGPSALTLASSGSLLQTALNGGWGFARGGTATARAAVPYGIQGGRGGGGGGGGAAIVGGGGGAGGGVLLIIASHVNVVSDGGLSAPGGAGGNTTSSAAPGGGGGGGAIVLLYRTKVNTALTVANSCPGGAAGTGGAGGGAAGSTGGLWMFQI